MVAYAVVVRSCGEISGAVGLVLVAVLESGGRGCGSRSHGAITGSWDCYGCCKSEPLHGCFMSFGFGNGAERVGAVRNWRRPITGAFDGTLEGELGDTFRIMHGLFLELLVFFRVSPEAFFFAFAQALLKPGQEGNIVFFICISDGDDLIDPSFILEECRIVGRGEPKLGFEHAQGHRDVAAGSFFNLGFLGRSVGRGDSRAGSGSFLGRTDGEAFSDGR